jgi:hypothetical protein
MNRKKRIISLAFAASLAAATLLPTGVKTHADCTYTVADNQVRIQLPQADLSTVTVNAGGVDRALYVLEKADGSLFDICNHGAARGEANVNCHWIAAPGALGDLDMTVTDLPAGTFRLAAVTRRAGSNDTPNVASFAAGQDPAYGDTAAGYGHANCATEALARKCFVGTNPKNMKCFEWFKVSAGFTLNRPTLAKTGTIFVLNGDLTSTRAGINLGTQRVEVTWSTDGLYDPAHTTPVTPKADGTWSLRLQQRQLNAVYSFRIKSPGDPDNTYEINESGDSLSSSGHESAGASQTTVGIGAQALTSDGANHWLVAKTYGTVTNPQAFSTRWTNTSTNQQAVRAVTYDQARGTLTSSSPVNGTTVFKVQLLLNNQPVSDEVSTAAAQQGNAEDAVTSVRPSTSAAHVALWRIAGTNWGAAAKVDGSPVTFAATGTLSDGTTLKLRQATCGPDANQVALFVFDVPTDKKFTSISYEVLDAKGERLSGKNVAV